MGNLKQDDIIKDMSKTQLFLYNFFLDEGTYLGGLRSLTDEEFGEAYDLIEQAAEDGCTDDEATDYLTIEAAMLFLLECPGEAISEDIFEKYFNTVVISYTIVSLNRKGLISYEVGEEDCLWKFKLKEHGRIRNRINKHQEDFERKI
jgi:hypothetical protein